MVSLTRIEPEHRTGRTTGHGAPSNDNCAKKRFVDTRGTYAEHNQHLRRELKRYRHLERFQNKSD